MRTFAVGDRVQTKSSAPERWIDGVVISLDGGEVCVDSGTFGLVIISRSRTWPKIQASNKPPPRVRHLPNPPTPEPEGEAVVVAPAESWLQKAAREFRPDPKPPSPGRSLAYMAHVRTAACISPACREINNVVPHHEAPRGTKAMGAKVSDFWCVPLCWHCHAFFHDHGHLGGCTVDETERLFLKAHHALLTQWLAMMPIEEQRALLVDAFDRAG